MFINYVFGHFVGDFFLQHKKMADNKNQTGWSASLWCTVHVFVYSATIAVFVGNFSPLFLLGVALPHWIADRFSIAYHWMKMLGRGELMHSSVPQQAAFGALIYVVLDQTFHLGCLYLLMQLVN